MTVIHKGMTREALIEMLMDDCIDSIRNGDAWGWVADIFTHGRVGFNDYTDAELIEAFDEWYPDWENGEEAA
jgi:hypothetical protein